MNNPKQASDHVVRPVREQVGAGAREYTMRISRLTVDKLGVKLYDKVSAVIAELISNSYDADATEVVVSAPMEQYLSSKAGGKITDKNFTISIRDTGFGMTPEELQEFFLVVGAERRQDPRRGDVSRKHNRKVMGRKGVGKLAPFGICRQIEILSSGGDLITKQSDDGEIIEGYLTAHIILDYDAILEDQDTASTPYMPEVGKYDGTLRDETGTEVILRHFNYRKVPNITLLARQIAQRFGISSPDWRIVLHDNSKTPSDPDYERVVGHFDVETLPNTRIDFRQKGSTGVAIGNDGNPVPGLEAGFEHDGRYYPLEGGWRTRRSRTRTT